jgi:hypothetical protein
MITFCIAFNIAGSIKEKIQIVLMCLALDATYIVPMAL